VWLYAPASGNVGNPVVVGNRIMPFISTSGQSQPPMVPLVLDPLMIGMNNPTYVPNANASGQALVQNVSLRRGYGEQERPGKAWRPSFRGSRSVICPAPSYVRTNASMQPLTPGGAERAVSRHRRPGVQQRDPNANQLVRFGDHDGCGKRRHVLSSGSTPTAQYVGANGLPYPASTTSITMSQGDYSWLVTIQPDISQVFGVQGQSGLFYESNAGTTGNSRPRWWCSKSGR